MKSFFAFSFLLFCLLLACEDPSNVGNGVIPDDDALPVDSIDFTDFVLNNYTDDTLFTGFRNIMTLGEVSQGQLGTGHASIYNEVSTGTYTVVDNPVLDSVVLYLRTVSYSGVEEEAQTFTVHTLQDSIPSNTGLLIDTTFTTNQQIGVFSDIIFSSDNVTINEQEVAPHISTHLDIPYFQDILNKLNDSTIVTTNELQNELLGVAILPSFSNSGKGLFTVDMSRLNGSQTSIRLYYTDAEDEQHTHVFNFSPVQDFTNSDDEYFAGVYNHNSLLVDNSSGIAEIGNQVDQFLQNGYNKGFIQGGHGIYTSITFDDLSQSLDPNIKVNSARLTIRPLLTQLSDTIHLPLSIGLYEEFELNDEGNKNGGVIGIDGSGLVIRDPNRIYDSFTIANRFKEEEGKYSYTFSIPNYMERFKNNEETGTLYLLSSSRGSSFQGIVFDKTLTEPGIHLRVKYTE